MFWLLNTLQQEFYLFFMVYIARIAAQKISKRPIRERGSKEDALFNTAFPEMLLLSISRNPAMKVTRANPAVTFLFLNQPMFSMIVYALVK